MNWEFYLCIHSIYILCFCLWLKIRDLFYANNDVHTFGTRHTDDLRLPSAKMKIFQRGTFYSGIRAYNNLPKKSKGLVA